MGISRFEGTTNEFITQNLSDQIDGNTINYTCKSFKKATIMVFWNGIRQTANEITVTSNSSFSTSFVASSGDSLTITFFKL